MASADFDYDRWGPLSFPVYWGNRVYSIWAGNTTQNITSAIGTGAVLYAGYNIASILWGFIRPSRILAYCHSSTGSWALVTGSSDGIGRAFSEELLDLGFNVLLHGRNESKLQGIQAELAQKFPKRKVDYVVADASRNDHPEDAVVEKVKQLPGKLTILINNVGGVNTSRVFATHASLPPEDIDTQLNINVRFPTQLTRGLIPILQENKPALISNIGSTAGTTGIPYLATYSGSKAFNHAFTKALQTELREGEHTDIEVMGFVIGNVLTAGNPSNMPLITMTAKACAKGCLAKVGSGNALELAGWPHAFQHYVFGLIPDRFGRPALVNEMMRRKAEVEKNL